MTVDTETTEETEVQAEEPENISDLFNDDGSEQDADNEASQSEETSDKGETETEETETDTDSQADTETEETESETPSEEDKTVPRRALIDERRKRQELEEKLERMRQEHGEREEDAPDPTDDPEGYKKYLRAQWEKEQWEKTATRSRDRMMEQHADYEEKEKHFLYLAQNNPELVKQMNEDPDPAAFAYNKAKESLDQQEKAVEDRVIERLRKEGKLIEEQEQTKDKGAASKVSDLTSATAAGKNTDETVKESENPEELFGDLSY